MSLNYPKILYLQIHPQLVDSEVRHLNAGIAAEA